jgi:ApbE superfamily uncharacterized protein (UPF0280 family)
MANLMYVERTYRQWSGKEGLNRFAVIIEQSDLQIQCRGDLKSEAMSLLKIARNEIESYITAHPSFGESLEPVDVREDAPPIIRSLSAAGRAWRVGPMAAVAGAVAQFVGRGLADRSDEVIVENGGDIYLRSSEPVRVALYAGESSPFSNKIAFLVNAANGIGVCTSSGVVGPSLSFGEADAVVAVSSDATFADAAATAVANHIAKPADVARVLDEEREEARLGGLIACCGDKLGMWGDIEIVKMGASPCDV